MSTGVLLAAGVVVLLGATVQGAVGFGMNMLAAPLLAVIDPVLVPASLLLVASVFAVLPVLRERTHTDWSGVRWAVLGRLPGTLIGVSALAVLPAEGLGILIGGVVLVSVGLSLLAWHPRPRPGTLFLAGLASGTFGTSAAIGGPPIALVYQHSAGPAVRSTMGAYFAAGSVLSVAALALGGQVGTQTVLAALVLVPFAVVGFFLSGPLRPLLDSGWTRPALLTVSAASALVLVVQFAL